MISSLDARMHRRTGRTIGVLLLVQIVFAPIANFVLLKPVFAALGFLENAAAHSLQVSLGALLGLGMGAISLGIAIAAFPVFRPLNRTLALWFLALAAVSFSLTAVESTTVMSMLSLSQAYAKARLGGWRALSGAAGGGRIGTQLGALHRADRCG